MSMPHAHFARGQIRPDPRATWAYNFGGPAAGIRSRYFGIAKRSVEVCVSGELSPGGVIVDGLPLHELRLLDAREHVEGQDAEAIEWVAFLTMELNNISPIVDIPKEHT